MVGQIIAALRRSPLVKDLEVIEMVEEENVQFLRVRIEIMDGSLLYIREAFFPDHNKIPTIGRLKQERCCCGGITLLTILRYQLIRTTGTRVRK